MAHAIANCTMIVKTVAPSLRLASFKQISAQRSDSLSGRLFLVCQPKALRNASLQVRAEQEGKQSKSKKTKAQKGMAQRKSGRPASGQQSSTAAPIPGRTTKVFRKDEEDIPLQRMEGLFDSFDEGAIHIDGSYFEGGGQVVRNAMALASITGQKLRISDVRANRKPSGLAYQHCTGVSWQSSLSLCPLIFLGIWTFFVVEEVFWKKQTDGVYTVQYTTIPLHDFLKSFPTSITRT